jgi:hypothetical protein
VRVRIEDCSHLTSLDRTDFSFWEHDEDADIPFCHAGRG